MGYSKQHVTTFHRVTALNYPDSTVGRAVREADAPARAELERQYGPLNDERAFSLLEQQDCLDAIERIQERDECSYREAMERAAREEPEAFERYLDATGRSA